MQRRILHQPSILATVVTLSVDLECPDEHLE